MSATNWKDWWLVATVVCVFLCLIAWASAGVAIWWWLHDLGASVTTMSWDPVRQGVLRFWPWALVVNALTIASWGCYRQYARWLKRSETMQQ
jgi:hypothetical protein